MSIMDPVTAIGFAASILTFIDFSWNVVTGTYEVYKSKSGTTAANVSISTVITDLNTVTDELDADVDSNNKHGKALSQLANGCYALSDDLLKILKRLQVTGKNTTWQSLNVKLAIMRKEKEVASIEKRLDQYRAQMILRLSLMLNDQQSSIRVRLDRIEKESFRLSEESATQFSFLRQAMSDMTQAPPLSSERDGDSEDPTDLKIMESLADLHSTLAKLLDLTRSLPRQNHILRLLEFGTMYTREDTVAKAEDGTFAWLFTRDPDSTGKPRSAETQLRIDAGDGLMKWLASGHGVYHISGRAGSGKSTLMKFLTQHRRVRKELVHWASDRKLVFAHFFFWASGDRLQRSLEGLHRCILFEVLGQCPELIPEIFPEEWASSAPTGVHELRRSLRLPEIKVAFTLLVQKSRWLKHRLCIFIDGLDEYDGDSVQHWELARAMAAWASSENVKICVSSRPHTEFMETFSDGCDHRMRLHELTAPDIRCYAAATFERDANFERVSDIYMDLVKELVRNADGVFLWAVLVLRSLLDAIGHRYPHAALWKRLDSTPKDLRLLYETLLEQINPMDWQKADQMFLLTSFCWGDNPFPPQHNALIYTWLENLDDPEFPFSSPFGACPVEEVARRWDELRCHLDGLTKGLLELCAVERLDDDPPYFDYTVQFLHRTVRDYFGDAARQNELRSRLPHFNPEKDFCRLLLAEFKFAPTQFIHWDKNRHLDHSQLYLILERVCQKMSLLDEIDSAFLCKMLGAFEQALTSHRQAPSNCPSHQGRPLEKIEWSLVIPYPLHTGELDFSYLHYLTSWGLDKYIIPRVVQDRDLLKTTGSLNLLLSAALSWQSGMVQFLLEQGALPNDSVPPVDSTGEDHADGTVWLFFILHHARWALELYQQCRKDKFCKKAIYDRFTIMEHLLKFGADRDVLILLETEHAPENDTRIVSAAGQMREALLDGEKADEPGNIGETTVLWPRLVYISLLQLVQLLEPPNSDSLQSLLQENGFARRRSDAFQNLLSWPIGGLVTRPHASAYEPLTVEILRSIKSALTVFGIYSKSAELECGALARVY